MKHVISEVVFLKIPRFIVSKVYEESSWKALPLIRNSELAGSSTSAELSRPVTSEQNRPCKQTNNTDSHIQ